MKILSLIAVFLTAACSVVTEPYVIDGEWLWEDVDLRTMEITRHSLVLDQNYVFGTNSITVAYEGSVYEGRLSGSNLIVDIIDEEILSPPALFKKQNN